MATGDVISVVVIDDHPAILAGVRAWFVASDPPVRVLAAGATVKMAWIPPGDAADVVVLDLQLNTGVTSTYGDLRRLVDAGRRVVIYTMMEDEQVALDCLDLGAASYVTKAEGGAHLVAATVAAAQHRPYVPPAMAGAIAADLRPSRPRLSAREQEVLVEWFQSDSKGHVAKRLGVSVRTVNTHLDRVRLKYANVGRPAATKAALLARAIQDGLIEPGDL